MTSLKANNRLVWTNSWESTPGPETDFESNFVLQTISEWIELQIQALTLEVQRIRQ